MSVLKPLYLALVAMFLQQTFAMIAKVAVPVAAAVAFPALGVGAENVGIFTGFYSCCQVVIVMFSGNLIRRYGGLRISQVGMLGILIGMTAAASGSIWAFALTAIFVSFGVSVSTPASAQILARYTPPRHAPLIFSLKQTSVPIGQIASGLLVPFLVALYGWRGAFIGVGLMCFAFAFLLEPTRRELDQDRDPAYPLSPRSIKADILFSLGNPDMRRQVLTQAAFAAVWGVYLTYIVVFFMDRLGYSLAAAGVMFATATLIGLPSRLISGYVASRWMSAGKVLAVLCLLTSAATVLTGFNTPDWPTWALLAVAVVFNIGATGWQGIGLSEIVRLAPPGRVGALTGSVIGLSCIGQVIVPPLFAVVLLLTDNYVLGFSLAAVPTLVAGIMLLWAERGRR